jgi:hypothetical protein
MSDNPVADILARFVSERSDVAARAFERATYDYAMARGCDLIRDAEAYTRLRVVTSAVRRGDYSEAWLRGALDALRDAIYSSRSRAEELRRRVDVALRVTQPMYKRSEVFVEGRRVDAVNYLASPRERERAEADAFGVDAMAGGPMRATFTVDTAQSDMLIAAIEDLARSGNALVVSGAEMRVDFVPLPRIGVAQQREADARETWRFRILNGLIPSRMRPCASCGVKSIGILCFACEHPADAASVFARWRERLAAWQRHVAPLPLGVLGGVCASRLYPEAPRAHDAVRLRCPLRRSPDRGVTLCVAQPTTDCVTPTRREA